MLLPAVLQVAPPRLGGGSLLSSGRPAPPQRLPVLCWHPHCLPPTHLECVLGPPIKNFGTAGEEENFGFAFFPVDLHVDSGSGAGTTHIPRPDLNLVVDH